ncbi:MAG: hypothetical protein HY718_11155, partial [Planctomycetes bacterium]|nr:hypothetical protein [Planctomycetota bacterium]
MPGVKRYLVPVCVNLVVPGPGLILLGRPWLGVGLAAWFTMGAEMGVFGLLIGPATVPRAVVLM